MGCRFSSIGKLVAQLSGNTRFPTTPCAGREAVFRGIPRLLRSGVLALSPYATKMGRSLLLAITGHSDTTKEACGSPSLQGGIFEQIKPHK
jgi:hypothetical protein